MKLTYQQIKNAKPEAKPYKMADGGGLTLFVTPAGGKLWRVRFRVDGKEKQLALGSWPEVSLADAREKLTEARQQLTQGQDPAFIKQVQKLKGLELKGSSFAVIAEQWFALAMAEKSETHRHRTRRIIEADLNPRLGKYPLSEITPQMILATLKAVEGRGALETAKRARQIAGQIFRHGLSLGICDRDPTADLKGLLQTRQSKHFAAITAPVPLDPPLTPGIGIQALIPYISPTSWYL